jgi:hypothetical protein
MTTSFIQKERQRIFKDLTRQYQREGYTTKESKRMAKIETDDIMADKETFVENFVQDVWSETDE